MSDTTITRLCLSETCGRTHECRHPGSACVCPFCGSDAIETVGTERLPGFEDVVAKPADRRYPS